MTLLLPLSPADAATLAWLFVNPIDLPSGARLWMLLPLIICVALVYRATRIRTAQKLWKSTITTSVNILVGMLLIAGAFYVAHLLAQRLL